MSSVVIAGDTSGTVTLAAPSVAGTTTLTLPSTSGNVLTSVSSIATSQLSGSISASSLPAGSILQVVSTNKTNVFSTTSGTAVDITGMTVNITPSSASNKILVQVTMSYGSDVSSYPKVTLLRNDSSINIGDASGSCSRVSIPMNVGTDAASQLFTTSMTYLDSPATTSALTYKLQVFTFSSRGFYLNRSAATSDANHLAATSSITVIEVKG